MDSLRSLYAPLIGFQQQVEYMTKGQRSYEAKLYGVELEEGETIESDEFMKRLQARMQASNDPLALPYIGGTEETETELATIKKHVTDLEKVINTNNITNADDLKTFTMVTLNACTHLFLRWNRIELIEPTEIERRGNGNRKLRALYEHLVKMSQQWPMLTQNQLEENSKGAGTSAQALNSTVKNEQEENGLEQRIDELGNLSDESVVFMGPVPKPMRDQDGTQGATGPTQRGATSSREVAPLDWGQGMTEIRAELERQRLQFEARFEVEHHAMLRHAEASRADMAKSREYIEAKITRQGIDLKNSIETFMFEILAIRRSDSPNLTHEMATEEQNRRLANGMAALEERTGPIGNGWVANNGVTQNAPTAVNRSNPFLDPLEEIVPTPQVFTTRPMGTTATNPLTNRAPVRDSGSSWNMDQVRRFLHSPGNFVQPETTVGPTFQIREFEERAKKLKLISQEVKNHKLYFGGKFSQSFEVYVSILNQFMKHMGLESETMKTYIYLTLEGKPREWYVSLEQAEKELPLNEFLALMRRRFVDSRTPALWIAELQSQKYEYKKHGPISDWIDYMNLQMMSDGCGWTDGDRAAMIIRSLPERLRIPLHSKMIASVRELRAIVEEFYPSERSQQCLAPPKTNRFQHNFRNNHHETAEIEVQTNEESEEELEEEICYMAQRGTDERNRVNKKQYRADRSQLNANAKTFRPHPHARDNEARRCFRCGDEGHFFKDCTSTKIKIACFWCKRPEVVTSTCTTSECIQRREEKEKN